MLLSCCSRHAGRVSRRQCRPVGTCMVVVRSFEAQVDSGESLRNLSQKGSGVTLNCVPWFVFSFAFVGWLGLGFVSGLSLPRSQESSSPCPWSMTGMEFSVDHQETDPHCR